jgi:hypothetical protein
MISLEEKFNCVTRELEMRRDVYRRLVIRGKMNRERADHEIKTMQAIVEDYQQQLQGELKFEPMKGMQNG